MNRHLFAIEALLQEWNSTVGLGSEEDDDECSVDVLYSWASSAADLLRDVLKEA